MTRLVPLVLALLVACPAPQEEDSRPPRDDTGGDTTDTGDTTDDPGAARWNFLVFLNVDNDLEGLVMHDLNELEATGSGDGVNILVQVDRAEGYSDADGDWTGTRRYLIQHDDDLSVFSTPILEDLGEQDMGDPAVLSDFLMWAHTHYPAEHTVLVFWNHGDGWSRGPDGVEPPGVSWDDESGNGFSFAEGEVHAALAPFVAAAGPLDVVGFDACNMAFWEVAHTLRDQAAVMTAAQTTVSVQGYQYGPVVALLRTRPDTTAAELALEMARGVVEDGNEWSHSAVDLAAMDGLAAALDDLAGAVLADSSLEDPLLAARDAARGADSWWKDWYLDLGDLAARLQASGEPELAAQGAAVAAALDTAVLGTWSNVPYEWLGGLNLFFDLDWPVDLQVYANGAGATWAQETRWDDLLLHLAEDR